MGFFLPPWISLKNRSSSTVGRELLKNATPVNGTASRKIEASNAPLMPSEFLMHQIRPCKIPSAVTYEKLQSMRRQTQPEFSAKCGIVRTFTSLIRAETSAADCARLALIYALAKSAQSHKVIYFRGIKVKPYCHGGGGGQQLTKSVFKKHALNVSS